MVLLLYSIHQCESIHYLSSWIGIWPVWMLIESLTLLVTLHSTEWTLFHVSILSNSITCLSKNPKTVLYYNKKIILLYERHTECRTLIGMSYSSWWHDIFQSTTTTDKPITCHTIEMSWDYCKEIGFSIEMTRCSYEFNLLQRWR